MRKPLSAAIENGLYLTRSSLWMGVLALVLSVPALSQSRLTVDHLDQHVYVSDPQISPDGEWVAYVAGQADLEEDEEVSMLWMINWEGDEQLQLTLNETIENFFRLRIQAQTERLDAPSELRRHRRLIARIRTLMREREIAGQSSAAPAAAAR